VGHSPRYKQISERPTRSRLRESAHLYSPVRALWFPMALQMNRPEALRTFFRSVRYAVKDKPASRELIIADDAERCDCFDVVDKNLCEERHLRNSRESINGLIA